MKRRRGGRPNISNILNEEVDWKAMNEWMNEWMNERINEWMNESIKTNLINVEIDNTSNILQSEKNNIKKHRFFFYIGDRAKKNVFYVELSLFTAFVYIIQIQIIIYVWIFTYNT